MAATTCDTLASVLSNFTKITKAWKKKEKSKKSQNERTSDIKSLIKSMYDHTKQMCLLQPEEGLGELIVDNFDDEQIWQELEMDNVPSVKVLTGSVFQLLKQRDDIVLPFASSSADDESVCDTQNEDNAPDEEEGDSVGEEENEQQSEGSGADDDDDGDVENEEDFFQMKPVPSRPSTVDDEFFKLSEMEDFLNQEDKKEMNQQNDDSDDESIDLFTDVNDVADEVEVNPRYDDFFNDFNEKGKGASSFEKQQQRIKQRIEGLEEAAVGEKSWQLQGEVAAVNRPPEALLEEYLEFDQNIMKCPVITAEVTQTVEEILKQRIKDKSWDNPERKVKPVRNIHEYKKEITLDHEKSKLSLAEQYAQEYVKQQQDEKEEQKELPEHVEIKNLMTTLFRQLEAMTNLHFIPKPPVPELKIVSNLPALLTEEVGPVAESSDMLLAPEEVKAKSRGEFIGTKERTATDKKRQLRQKKKRQHSISMRKQAKELHGKSNSTKKTNKEAAVQDLIKSAKSGKVTLMKQTEKKAVKSSSVFFEKLQDVTTNEHNPQKRKAASRGKGGKPSKKARKM